LRLPPDRARSASALAAAAFVGLARLAALLLLLAGLLRLLLFGLTATGLPLLELLVELFIFLEADVLALLGLELHAAIAFGLISAALRLRLLAVALGLAALHRAALALLFLLAAAGAGILVLLLAGILLPGGLLLLLSGSLLALVPGLVGHEILLSFRDVAGERLTLGRAVYPVR
jgi:hypothetical protein